MNTQQNEIIPHLFREKLIRTTIILGTVWFCGKDVCAALGIENSRDALTTLRATEKITVGNADGNPRAGIPHEMTYINEPGLYRLVFKSRKAEAVVFQDWVFGVLLPRIRKEGLPAPRSSNLTQEQNAFFEIYQQLLDTGLPAVHANRSALRLSAAPPAPRARPISSQSIPRDEEMEEVLSLMEAGESYTIASLSAALPRKHRLSKGGKAASASAIGKLLKAARDQGRVTADFDSNRRNTYSLPVVVPFTSAAE